jgi:hypothetical protein
MVRRVGVAGLLLRWRQAPGESALVPGHDDAAVPRVPVHESHLPGQQRPLERRSTDLHSLTRYRHRGEIDLPFDGALKPLQRVTAPGTKGTFSGTLQPQPSKAATAPLVVTAGTFDVGIP